MFVDVKIDACNKWNELIVEKIKYYQHIWKWKVMIYYILPHDFQMELIALSCHGLLHLELIACGSIASNRSMSPGRSGTATPNLGKLKYEISVPFTLYNFLHRIKTVVREKQKTKSVCTRKCTLTLEAIEPYNENWYPFANIVLNLMQSLASYETATFLWGMYFFIRDSHFCK